jgi:hypothetical protein
MDRIGPLVRSVVFYCPMIVSVSCLTQLTTIELPYKTIKRVSKKRGVQFRFHHLAGVEQAWYEESIT